MTKLLKKDWQKTRRKRQGRGQWIGQTSGSADTLGSSTVLNRTGSCSVCVIPAEHQNSLHELRMVTGKGVAIRQLDLMTKQMHDPNVPSVIISDPECLKYLNENLGPNWEIKKSITSEILPNNTGRITKYFIGSKQTSIASSSTNY